MLKKCVVSIDYQHCGTSQKEKGVRGDDVIERTTAKAEGVENMGKILGFVLVLFNNSMKDFVTSLVQKSDTSSTAT